MKFKDITLEPGGYYVLHFKGDPFPEYLHVRNGVIMTLSWWKQEPEYDCWEFSHDTSFEGSDDMDIILFEPMSEDRIKWMNECIYSDSAFYDWEGNVV